MRGFEKKGLSPQNEWFLEPLGLKVKNIFIYIKMETDFVDVTGKLKTNRGIVKIENYFYVPHNTLVIIKNTQEKLSLKYEFVLTINFYIFYHLKAICISIVKLIIMKRGILKQKNCYYVD